MITGILTVSVHGFYEGMIQLAREVSSKIGLHVRKSDIFGNRAQKMQDQIHSASVCVRRPNRFRRNFTGTMWSRTESFSRFCVEVFLCGTQTRQ